MHYHDPLRPKYNGHGSNCGLIVRHDGTALGPLSALPLLNLEPLPDGRWWLRVHLLVGRAAFREFEATTSDILGFLRRWQEDPEGVLREDFKYDFRVATRHPTVSGTTLADLGL